MQTLPIGVATLNWRAPDDTVRCLASVLDADPGPARVVVVDNGSGDGSVEALERWLGERGDRRATLVSATHNGGFAVGTNLGLARLAADHRLEHFFALNNDATVAPDFFAELASALAAAPGAGIVGVTIYEGAGHDRVWYAGGLLRRVRAMATHLRHIPSGRDPIATEFVTGGAMVISRRAWNVLGPLPECYFIYLEDAEYCHRAREAGFPVVYAPRAVVNHGVGVTVRRLVPRALTEYRFARGRALYVRRNVRGWRRWAAIAYLTFTRAARLVAETARGRPAVGLALVRGTLSGFFSPEGASGVSPRHQAHGGEQQNRVQRHA